MITTTTDDDDDLTLLKNTFRIGFPCKLSDKKQGRGPCSQYGSWKLNKKNMNRKDREYVHAKYICIF